jgi:hypothetical protein
MDFQTALELRKRGAFKDYARHVFCEMKKDMLWPELIPDGVAASTLAIGLEKTGIIVKPQDIKKLETGWSKERDNFFEQKEEWEKNKKTKEG